MGWNVGWNVGWKLDSQFPKLLVLPSIDPLDRRFRHRNSVDRSPSFLKTLTLPQKFNWFGGKLASHEALTRLVKRESKRLDNNLRNATQPVSSDLKIGLIPVDNLHLYSGATSLDLSSIHGCEPGKISFLRFIQNLKNLGFFVVERVAGIT